MLALRKLSDWLRAIALFAVLIGLIAVLQTYSKVELSGNIRVLDGDSIRLNGEEVRLFGIDAPEYKQICLGKNGNKYACGQNARNHLRSLVRGKEAHCIGSSRDKYERFLAVCNVSNMDINRQMVLSGWAVSFGSYVAEENSARLAKKGIWSGRFQTPAEWRRDEREAHNSGFLSSLFGW